MKTKEWIAVIIAIIVIAVIVSLITVNLTGNVIKLNQDRWGKYEAYTKAEVDSKLDTITSQMSEIVSRIENPIEQNQKILTMLENSCITTNSLLYDISSPTGASVCDSYNSQYQKSTTCVLVQQGRGSSVIVPCNINLGANMTIPNYVMCCTP